MLARKRMEDFPILGDGAYFIWRGRRTSEYDIAVERLPARILPQKRGAEYSVPGRSGSVRVEEDAYDNYTRSAECLLLTPSLASEAARWLSGSGDLVLSDEPGFRYEARVKNNLSLQRVWNSGQARFIVQFDCQPFRYEIECEPLTLTRSGSTVFGRGNVPAAPVFEVHGRGEIEISVNGRAFGLRGVDGTITVDSLMLVAYTKGASGAVLANASMLGEFPELKPGENIISWTGNVDKLVITPNWRWI